MNYKRIFCALALFALPMFASAATPTIQTFSATTNSMYSGQVASFSWTIANGGGSTLFIPCIQGMKLKRTDGTAIACDTPISTIYPTAAFSTSEGVDIIASNLSGGTTSFTLRLIPKDTAGADNTSAQQSLSVSVAPAINTIDTITGAATSSSYAAYNLSWTSNVLDGTNLSISCSSDIRATSTSYTGFLPCNTPIFSSDLPGSGSTVLYFNNIAPSSRDITLTLLAAMSPGAYNGAQSKSITVSVETNITPDPITTSFTASNSGGRTAAGTPITLTWTTDRSAGANLRFSCNDNITTTLVANNSTSTAKCSNLAFDTALPANSNATVTFENKSSYANEPITVTVVPARKDGGFDATHGKELSFTILPKTTAATQTTTTTTAIPVTTTQTTTTSTVPGCTSTTGFSVTTGKPCGSATTTTTTTSTTTTKPTTAMSISVSLTKYLSRGSSNSEVRALQEFLSKDSVIYPEASVTGYFGPATERAVMRLQEKNNIASKGVAGYGAVGPKTRAFINSFKK